jgi:hypothetical protein
VCVLFVFSGVGFSTNRSDSWQRVAIASTVVPTCVEVTENILWLAREDEKSSRIPSKHG